MTPAPDSPLAVLRSALPRLSGAEVLDIGCGAGDLLSLLSAEGALPTGVDPAASAVAQARQAAPTAAVHQIEAEALPFADDSFDAAIFVNSLHHIPVADMDRALAKATRALRPGGPLIVVEPLAEGPFFEASRPIDDETAVRAAAQAAISRAPGAVPLALEATHAWVRRSRYDDAEAFLRRIVGVDPARAARLEAERDVLIAHVEAVAARDSDGALVLEQPITAVVLRKAC